MISTEITSRLDRVENLLKELKKEIEVIKEEILEEDLTEEEKKEINRRLKEEIIDADDIFEFLEKEINK